MLAALCGQRGGQPEGAAPCARPPSRRVSFRALALLLLGATHCVAPAAFAGASGGGEPGPPVFPLAVSPLAVSSPANLLGESTDEGELLSLPFVLAHAREADLRFALSALEERLARLGASEALGRALPSLALGATLTRNAREIRVGEGSSARVVTPLWLPLGSVVTRVPLVRGEDFAAAYASALDADAVHHQEQETRKVLLAEVATTFIGLAEQQQRVIALRDAEVAAESLWRLAQARARAGSSVQLDVDLADAERLRARAARANAEGEVQQALVTLAQLLDLPLPAQGVARCEGCIPVPSPPPGAGDLSSARLDLVALRLRSDAARARRLGQRLTWLPTLEAVANVRLGQPTLFNPEWLFWNAQLQLSWDLFSGSARAFATAAAEARVSQSELSLSLAEREARVAISAAAEAYRAAGLVRDATAARAAAAARAFELAGVRYREGLISMTELTQAARGEAEARVDLVRARFDLERSALRWRLALGLEPLEEGGA